VRLLTTAEVLAGYGNPPLSNREAWDVIDGFMEDERFTFANELEGVEETWKFLVISDTHSTKLWIDAKNLNFLKDVCSAYSCAV
jgi:hypothetical protein